MSKRFRGGKVENIAALGHEKAPDQSRTVPGRSWASPGLLERHRADISAQSQRHGDGRHIKQTIPVQINQKREAAITLLNMFHVPFLCLPECLVRGFSQGLMARPYPKCGIFRAKPALRGAHHARAPAPAYGQRRSLVSPKAISASTSTRPIAIRMLSTRSLGLRRATAS